MSHEIVPIVFAADENYIFSTCVAIYSLLKNSTSKETTIIYILADTEYSQEGKLCIEKVRDEFQDAVIKVLSIDKSLFSKTKMRVKHTSLTTMYRLKLPSILKDYNRCLYIDTDVLVLNDLCELMQTDIKGCFCAGVLDNEAQMCALYKKELELLDMYSYINAGVLLMNLALMRETSIEDAFMCAIDKGYPLQDQDIINKYCYGKIRLLSERYNCFSRRHKYPENICILHFSGGPDVHPWENRKTKNDSLWWKYAAFFQDTCKYQETLEKAEQYAKDRDCQRLLNECKSANRVYVWGYTEKSFGLVRLLLKKGVDNIVSFIDNDDNKTGCAFEGIPVKRASQLEMGIGTLVINTAQKRKKEVDEQILKLGLKEVNIVHFFEKSDFYYRVLDKRYCDTEICDLLLMKYGIILD